MGRRVRKGWLVAELRGSVLARRNHVCTGPQVAKAGKGANRTGTGGGKREGGETEREPGAKLRGRSL